MHYARAEALQVIREFLQSKQRQDETTCQTAARLGIFCRGYNHWTDGQLREQYPWLAERLPLNTPREELLKLVVAWDGARQLVHRVGTTCDAKSIDRDGCLGFDGFSNEQLKRGFPQIFHQEDTITPY